MSAPDNRFAAFDASEVWAPIPGFESSYEISTFGRVRSLTRVVPSRRWGHKKVQGRDMVLAECCDGYRGVNLCAEGVAYKRLVHRLVALTFLGKSDLPVVRHLDGDKTNNRVTNLAWGTDKENTGDRWTHGTMIFGEAHRRAVLSDSQVQIIRRMHARKFSTKGLARSFGVGESTIHNVVKRNTWRHV